jgi:hypothetical protein
MRALAAAFWLPIALAAQAQAPADFAYRRSLATAGDSAFFRVALPAAVHEGVVRGDLGDLRVFNANGTAVAFAWLPRAVPGREASLPVALPIFPLRVETGRRDLGDLSISVQRDAAGGARVDLATRDGTAVAAERLAGYLVDATGLDHPLAALTLTLSGGVNVDTRVRVEASDDLRTWRTLITGAMVASLDHAGRHFHHTRIDVEAVRAKYLRLSFEPGWPTPEIATLWGEFADRPVDAPRQWRQVEGSVDHDHPGDYLFDLGGAFPVDRVTLELPERNSVAPAELYTRTSPKEDWRLIGTTVFYRLHQDGLEATNPPLAVPGEAQRYYRVRVDPRSGGRVDQPPKLSAGWLPRVLVFAARGDGPFELAYGSARAQPAALSIEKLVPGYDARRTPATFAVATVGEAKLAPALAALRAPIDVKRWLLWGTLAFATLVLGWMAHAVSRQMRAGPPRADDSPPANPSPHGTEH